ncbi:MAG: hypothetical protein JST30_12475 [Armatimonadetes bacterium]|nr:hypothetical protein [Armatimonadota bacterium]
MLREREGGEFEEEALLAEAYRAKSWPGQRPNRENIKIARRMKAEMKVGEGPSGGPPPASPWEYIGPTNLLNDGNDYAFGPSPVNGRVNCAVYDPFDQETIYAASAMGGVWKSENTGVNWTPLSDSWDQLEMSCIAANPIIQGHFYAGTGDETGSGNYDYGAGIGVMVTKDNGATWTQSGFPGPFSETKIADIVADAQDPARIFVAAGGGDDEWVKLYMSPDEGTTWQVSLNVFAHWYDLDAVTTTSGGDYIWATGKLQDGTLTLRVTTDHGSTWTNVPLPYRGTSSDRLYVAGSKVNPAKPYIYYTGSQRVYAGGAFLGMWSNITGDLPTVSDGVWAQASYNNGLTCFKRTFGGTTDALVVNNCDSYISKDATGTWVAVANGYTGDDTAHVDHHNFTPHPVDPNQFLLSTDGGVTRCIYNPATNTFATVQTSKKLGCTLVTRISVDATVPTGIIAGLQDNGFARCGVDVLNWDNLLGADCGHSAIDQEVPGIQYMMPPNFDKDDEGEGYIWFTSNGWADREELWINTLGEKHRNSPPIVLDPSSQRTMYCATDYLHRYDFVTKQWETKLGNQLLSVEGHVRHLAVAPSDSDRIYTVSGEGEVWMSKDRGDSWAPIHTGTPGLPVESIGHVSVDPNDRNRILVTLEGTGLTGKLWECQNTTAATRVWSDRTGTVAGKMLPVAPAAAIARHPDNPSKVWFVANELGVYLTRDEGKTWEDFTPKGQFPGVAVSDMVAHKFTKTLIVSTYGRGVWKRSIKRLPMPRPWSRG